MTTSDRAAYYSVVAAILLTAIFASLAVFRDITSDAAERRLDITDRLVLAFMTAILLFASFAVAAIPDAIWSGETWLTRPVVNFVVGALVGVFVIARIAGLAMVIFSRGPRPESEPEVETEPEQKSAPRWLVVALVLIAFARRRGPT